MQKLVILVLGLALFGACYARVETEAVPEPVKAAKLVVLEVEGMS